MEKALARHVALAGYHSRQELNDVAELLQNHVSPTEYEKFREAVALVSAKVQVLLDIVFANHPDLEQDLDDKTMKYGKTI